MCSLAWVSCCPFCAFCCHHVLTSYACYPAEHNHAHSTMLLAPGRRGGESNPSASCCACTCISSPSAAFAAGSSGEWLPASVYRRCGLSTKTREQHFVYGLTSRQATIYRQQCMRYLLPRFSYVGVCSNTLRGFSFDGSGTACVFI
jgi:hypothetical protein